MLKAFKACAASQGDTNNLTFGFGGNTLNQTEVRGFGYYETIAGGSGAGPTWEGTDGVHTHMTNTRITDAEILERRYPVVLREFSLRPRSGGPGQHCGGDGVIRDIEFKVPMKVSILSERRVHNPYGLSGGKHAQCGHNLWAKLIKSDESREAGKEIVSDDSSSLYKLINLGGKNTVEMNAGDRIIINTPGGGGWGAVEAASQVMYAKDAKALWKMGSIFNRQQTAESSV